MYSVDTILRQYLAAMVGVGGRLVTLRRLPFTVTSGLNVYFSFTIPDEELNRPFFLHPSERTRLVKQCKGTKIIVINQIFEYIINQKLIHLTKFVSFGCHIYTI